MLYSFLHLKKEMRMDRNNLWKHSSEPPEFGSIVICLGVSDPANTTVGTYGSDIIFDEDTDCQWCKLRDIVPENYKFLKEQW